MVKSPLSIAMFLVAREETKFFSRSLVPTLCVGMQVRDARRPVPPLDAERLGGIPTQSMGTRNEKKT
jgi:hypothetical protein